MVPRRDDAYVVGRSYAGYRIVQLLASGGTAHVMLAEQTLTASVRRVALKVLRPEHRANAALRARFEREAVAAERVRHPNVLEVIDVHREDGALTAFAMELLVGLDLADTLAYSRKLAPWRAARIALGVAEGLAAAHALGVVHRDVKPENIFLVHAPDGREIVKLLDFGFAHFPGAPEIEHEVVGTPEYMAPEQARGATAHASADIYALGVVLFELLAGRLPFIAAYPAIAQLHRSAPLPALSAPPELAEIVRRALAKSPADRFGSMSEVAKALQAALERMELDIR